MVHGLEAEAVVVRMLCAVELVHLRTAPCASISRREMRSMWLEQGWLHLNRNYWAFVTFVPVEFWLILFVSEIFLNHLLPKIRISVFVVAIKFVDSTGKLYQVLKQAIVDLTFVFHPYLWDCSNALFWVLDRRSLSVQLILVSEYKGILCAVVHSYDSTLSNLSRRVVPCFCLLFYFYRRHLKIGTLARPRRGTKESTN